MENNEDNRTPIQAEIERQKMIKESIERNYDGLTSDLAMRKIDHTVKVLQSLLEPEKEALIKARIGGACDPLLTKRTIPEMNPIAELWFTSTYTQQTK